MARVKLAPTLPKDDTQMNGLDEIADRMINHPNDVCYVVGIVRRTQLVIDDKRNGARQPTVEFVHIEGVTHSGDSSQIADLLERAARRRNGENPDQLDLRTASGVMTGDTLPF